MSDSVGIREKAIEWGYTQATISNWCRQGLIKGANQDKVGSPWHIPKDAECPKPIKLKGGHQNGK